MYVSTAVLSNIFTDKTLYTMLIFLWDEYIEIHRKILQKSSEGNITF